MKSFSCFGSPFIVGTFLSAWILALGARPGISQPPPPPPEKAAESADMTASETLESKISIHGFMSQAYAKTDGNSIAGITDRGTADYRAAAVQIRAEVTPQDSFAVQFSHERLGETGIQVFQQDVELDWIFFEHRFAEGLAVKVGRVQIPFGIYNEVRDVGTLFPFFRPSSNFYGEGSFTSEAVDGIVLSRAFDLGGAWRLDGDLHYGNWAFISRAGDGFSRKRVRNSRGAEVWLQTPVSGLRIGAGGIKYDVVTDGVAGSEAWDTYHASLEWIAGRIATQAEYKKIHFVGGDYDAGYVRLGVGVTDKVTLNGQIDKANLKIDFFRSGEFDNDRVLGVSYAFRPDLVLKGEHHWNKGYTPEVPVQNFFAPEPKTRYWIVSLSAAF